jgi:hypothetical protein
MRAELAHQGWWLMAARRNQSSHSQRVFSRTDFAQPLVTMHSKYCTRGPGTARLQSGDEDGAVMVVADFRQVGLLLLLPLPILTPLPTPFLTEGKGGVGQAVVMVIVLNLYD